jgi:hypothetical protein
MTPTRHFLFHNRGDGTFEDVTEKAGVYKTNGRGMGIVTVDVNRDGWTDIYVANDLCPNFLFLNRGDGTFSEIGELSGAACSEAGVNQAGMGVDAVDVDEDGMPDLMVTNFQGEYNTLYHNLDGTNFSDVSSPAGIVKDALPDVGWGCTLDDLDNDGLPDIMVVNGHVDDNLPQFNGGPPQHERSKIWRNVGNGRFAFQPNPGPFFLTENVARGAAWGDLNNDGRIDAVIVRLDADAVVLLNDSSQERRHFIGLDLLARSSNRGAIGAIVEIHVLDRVFHRQIRGGRSYHSTCDRRLWVGLGDAPRVSKVVIRWPSGIVSELSAPAMDQLNVVREPDDAAVPGEKKS